MIGLDTGFFLRLLAGDEDARRVWDPVAAGAARAAISCVTLYELDRVALRGAADRAAIDALLDDLPLLCVVVWLGEAGGAGALRRAARLAHGAGLAMADALILSSLLDAGAAVVYTTDADLERHRGAARIVRL